MKKPHHAFGVAGGAVKKSYKQTSFISPPFSFQPRADVSAAAAGEVAAAASFFLDFFAGEVDASAAGDSLAAGDASLAAFFFDFLPGEAEASGDEAGEAFTAGDGD